MPCDGMYATCSVDKAGKTPRLAATHPLAMHWASLLLELLHGVTLGQPHSNPFDCSHGGSGALEL